MAVISTTTTCFVSSNAHIQLLVVGTAGAPKNGGWGEGKTSWRGGGGNFGKKSKFE